MMNLAHNANSHAVPSVRVVIVARRQLDSDAWAALCQSHPDFRVVCATVNLEMACVICRHRRPEVVLFDADFIGRDGCPSIRWLLDEIAEPPILLVDDEVNEARLTMILGLPRVGYFTRYVSFMEIAAGIGRLLRGERAFGPKVEERLLLTDKGWQLRRDRSSSPLSRLTPREMEVLRLIALGQTIKDCATTLNLSPSTIDNHKSRLMKKLGVHRSLDLTRLAIREGLVNV